MQVGFIGLGIMGSRMAANLLENGHDLVVHNRTRDKAEALLSAGARWADTPAGAARGVEVVVTMLSTPEVVQALEQAGVPFTGARSDFYEPTRIAMKEACARAGVAYPDYVLARGETDVQEALDRKTDPWGIKVSNVEIKHVDLDESMIRAIAKQAEAEREKRAKIIHAEGERDAAETLAGAAEKLAQEPNALQLRYLQTLTEIAPGGSHTILFPLPMDLVKPLLSIAEHMSDKGRA